MKLTFIGANHEVTGSCHYLEVCGKKDHRLITEWNRASTSFKTHRPPSPLPKQKLF